jgi:hypothetical protein
VREGQRPNIVRGEVRFALIERRIDAFDEVEILRGVDRPAQLALVDVLGEGGEGEAFRTPVDEGCDVFPLVGVNRFALGGLQGVEACSRTQASITSGSANGQSAVNRTT